MLENILAFKKNTLHKINVNILYSRMFFDENLIIEKICNKLDQMIDMNEKIAIGVSGGVDSLFLAFILANYYKINFVRIQFFLSLISGQQYTIIAIDK